MQTLERKEAGSSGRQVMTTLGSHTCCAREEVAWAEGAPEALRASLSSELRSASCRKRSKKRARLTSAPASRRLQPPPHTQHQHVSRRAEPSLAQA